MVIWCRHQAPPHHLLVDTGAYFSALQLCPVLTLPLLSNFWTARLLFTSSLTPHLTPIILKTLSQLTCPLAVLHPHERVNTLLSTRPQSQWKTPKSAITRGDGALYEENFSTMMRREVFEAIRNLSQRRWRSPSPRRKCISHRCTRVWYIHEIRTVFMFRPGREHHAGIPTGSILPGQNNRYGMRFGSEPFMGSLLC